MSDLISRDDLLEVIVKRKRPESGADCSKERYRYMQWLADYWAIKDAPTIDAVEVVRCKECKHWDNKDDAQRCSYAHNGLHWAKPDDYCSYGERSE